MSNGLERCKRLVPQDGIELWSNRESRFRLARFSEALTCMLSHFASLIARRIQAVDARNSANRSDGFMNPRRLRGRSLRLWAMASRSARVSAEKSMPLGKY